MAGRDEAEGRKGIGHSRSVSTETGLVGRLSLLFVSLCPSGSMG